LFGAWGAFLARLFVKPAREKETPTAVSNDFEKTPTAAPTEIMPLEENFDCAVEEN
jgi:hypothetical protein